MLANLPPTSHPAQNFQRDFIQSGNSAGKQPREVATIGDNELPHFGPLIARLSEYRRKAGQSKRRGSCRFPPVRCKPADSQPNLSRVILRGRWGTYSVYHLHLGGFCFCHSVWHDGESATGLREVILLRATDCAQRTHNDDARSLTVIG